MFNPYNHLLAARRLVCVFGSQYVHMHTRDPATYPSWVRYRQTQILTSIVDVAPPQKECQAKEGS